MRTILLASQCPFVLSGLNNVVATFKDVVAVYYQMRDDDPQVVLQKGAVDLMVFDLSFSEGLNQRYLLSVMKKFPRLKVIILTASSSASWIVPLAEMGVHSIISKSSSSLEEMEDAIRSVLMGDKYFPASIEKIIQDAILNNSVTNNIFSKNHLLVVYLISQGLTTKQIAVSLGKPYKTIENNRSYLLRKTGCMNASELVNYFHQHNLIDESFENLLANVNRVVIPMKS